MSIFDRQKIMIFDIYSANSAANTYREGRRCIKNQKLLHGPLINLSRQQRDHCGDGHDQLELVRARQQLVLTTVEMVTTSILDQWFM